MATPTVPAAQPATPLNPFVVELPEKLDFRRPEEWKRWFTRWERYRVISGLKKQDDETQVNTLIYAMGREAEDVLASLKLSDAEKLNYDAVTRAFAKHFVPRTNVIYERAKFNSRKQEAHESVDAFVTELYRLAETCEYGDLKEELIRDRLVVGLADTQLSEKLQLNAELTLEAAVTAARNSETIKQQQKDLRPQQQTPAAIDAMRGCSKSKGKRNQRSQKTQRDQTALTCKWCGSTTHPPSRTMCPANGKICSACGKKGHFAAVCLSASPRKKKSTHQAVLEEVYLGQLTDQQDSGPWRTDVTVNGLPMKFKVDTGADVTAIPTSLYNEQVMGNLKQAQKQLLGPGRTKIATVGLFSATLCWNGRVCQEEVYVIDKLHDALLGRPAIKSLDILPSLLEVTASTSKVSDPANILCHYPNLATGLGLLKTEYRIILLPDAKPSAITYPRRVPLPMLPSVKRELERMENLGVIRKVDEATEWCAPMVVAKKRGGELRICVDFGGLNKNILRERVVMPTVDECLARLAGATWFSKLDARAGYWQAPLAPESQKYTTFLTPFGRFQFLRLPFGISTAPEFFQREMLRVLEGIEGQACLQDDIIVFGPSREEHDARLHKVLQRLQEAGITLNAEKCVLHQQSVRFLGHIVSANGISADPEKVSALCHLAEPTDVTEVRSFLGMANHLAKFLPGLSQLTKPLRDLLHSDAEWCWDKPQQESFNAVKKALTTTPVLTHYDPCSHHTVSADASSYGLGAVLLQETAGQRLPVAYASRSLSDTETRYAQIEKEALAVTWACEHFRSYLLGLQFHVETDHKPLVPLLSSSRLDELSPRLQRFRMRLLEFDYTIAHIPGKEMHTADVLSRKPQKETDNSRPRSLSKAIVEHEILTVELLPASHDMLEKIKAAQENDPVLARVRDYCTTSWPKEVALPPDVQRYSAFAHELTQVDGILLKGSRIVIPPSMQSDVLEHLHAGHQGIGRCRARATQSVWWPGINQHIQSYVSRCPVCQQHRKPHAEPMIFSPLPKHPWEAIGIDLFCVDGVNYLVVVDYYSRFFELKKLKRTTTENITQALSQIFARFGAPAIIRSDNGPQFASAQFKAFVKQWGSSHVTSSPYFPQSNGAAERTVQTAKQLIKKSPNIHKALLAHRDTPGKEGFTPAELLMGRRLRTDVPVAPDVLRPQWSTVEFTKRNEAYKVKQGQQYNRRHRTLARELIQPQTAVRILSGAPTTGTVIGPAHTPRSYVVSTPGGLTRRTSKHLQPLQPVATTRSGRTVRAPSRLDL